MASDALPKMSLQPTQGTLPGQLKAGPVLKATIVRSIRAPEPRSASVPAPPSSRLAAIVQFAFLERRTHYQ